VIPIDTTEPAAATAVASESHRFFEAIRVFM
jgi:hypothetical protein